MFLTHTQRHQEKEFLHKPLRSILRSKAASLDQVGHVISSAQDPIYESALGPWKQQRGTAQVPCTMSTHGLRAFPLTSTGRDQESASHSPAQLLLLQELQARCWEGQAGHDPARAMGSPSGKQLLVSMEWPQRSSSGTYNWILWVLWKIFPFTMKCKKNL